MKKLLQILLLSLGLIGCASLEFSASPAEAETKKILALGLTHTENLSEARKLTDPTLVSEVVQELKTRNDNARIEAEKVAKYAEKVKVSDSNSDNQIKFTGSEIYERKRVDFLTDYDYQDYFLRGWKDKNNGLIQHQLYLSLKYTSDNLRNYYSASFSNGSQIDITLISSNAVSCGTSGCDYTEIMELNLSDDFLRSNMETGFSIGFNSKKVTNKITISSDYIKGYLKVAK
jgi:hypothetical protein